MTGPPKISDLVAPARPDRRRRIVLVCYLDDSGSDDGSPIVTLAGYVAHAENWDAFEAAVEPLFAVAGVDCLNTKLLHRTKGCFAGWSVERKREFIEALYSVLRRSAIMGIAFSVTKKAYVEAKRRDGANHQISAYGFAMEATYNMLIAHERVGPLIREHGLSVIVESGNKNNPDLLRSYNALCAKYPDEFPALFRQLSFVDKNSCRAVQMADFLSFYFRRHSVESKPGEPTPRWYMLIEHVIQYLEHYGVISFSYYRNPKTISSTGQSGT